MTEDDLKAIEARAEAAKKEAGIIDNSWGTYLYHYGQDIPALIAEVRRLQDELWEAKRMSERVW